MQNLESIGFSNNTNKLIIISGFKFCMHVLSAKDSAAMFESKKFEVKKHRETRLWMVLPNTNKTDIFNCDGTKYFMTL